MLRYQLQSLTTLHTKAIVTFLQSKLSLVNVRHFNVRLYKVNCYQTKTTLTNAMEVIPQLILVEDSVKFDRNSFYFGFRVNVETAIHH